MKIPRLFITSDVQAKFPDLQEVMMPVYGVSVGRDEKILTEKDFEKLLGGKNEEEFFNQRDF